MGELEIEIRRADPAIDYERFAELRRKNHPDMTAELLRTLESQPGMTSYRAGAFCNGHMVGCGQASHSAHEADHRYRIGIWVDEEYLRQGIGRRLRDHLEDIARGFGAIELVVNVRDDCPEGRAFAEGSGYVFGDHTFESARDLSLPIRPTPEVPGLGFLRLPTPSRMTLLGGSSGSWIR